jgi:hypothetical protein
MFLMDFKKAESSIESAGDIGSRSRFRLVTLLLIAAACFFGLVRFGQEQTGSLVDDAHYIVLAEALASGQGYRLINCPDPIPEPVFPPGWPLCLAPFAALFPGNYAVLRAVSLLFWLASIPLIYRLLAPRLKSPYLEILLVLVVLNPFMVGSSVVVMSESAYIFVSLAALLAIEKCLSNGQSRMPACLASAALLMCAAQFIRTVGLSLILGGFSFFLFRRRFRDGCIFLFITGMAVGPQIIWHLVASGTLLSEGYDGQIMSSLPLAERGAAIWHNLSLYANSILSDVLFPYCGENGGFLLRKAGLGWLLPLVPGRMDLNLLVVALAALGFLLEARRLRVTEWYAGFYLAAILCFWNPHGTTTTSRSLLHLFAGAGVDSSPGATATPRFLLPILPLIYFYLMRGCLFLLSLIQPTEALATATLACVIGAMVGSISVSHDLRSWWNPPIEWQVDLSAGTSWINEHADTDAVVMTINPLSQYLYARRKTIGFPSEAQDLLPEIRKAGVEYLLFSPGLLPGQENWSEDMRKRLFPYVQAVPDLFRVVYSDPERDVFVYRVTDARLVSMPHK